MNNFTTDLIEALAQKQDIEEVFRLHLEHVINQLRKHELTCFLDYEPYELTLVTLEMVTMAVLLKQNMAS